MGKGAVSRFPELNVEEREQISRSIAQGCSARDIGRLLDRHHSTISREIERNGGPDAYRVVRAQERCDAQRVRPKEHKLVTLPAAARRSESGTEGQMVPGADPVSYT